MHGTCTHSEYFVQLWINNNPETKIEREYAKEVKKKMFRIVFIMCVSWVVLWFCLSAWSVCAFFVLAHTRPKWMRWKRSETTIEEIIINYYIIKCREYNILFIILFCLLLFACQGSWRNEQEVEVEEDRPKKSESLCLSSSFFASFYRPNCCFLFFSYFTLCIVSYL